jgi:hypothetical protein
VFSTISSGTVAYRVILNNMYYIIISLDLIYGEFSLMIVSGINFYAFFAGKIKP